MNRPSLLVTIGIGACAALFLACAPPQDRGTIIGDELLSPPRRTGRPLSQALGPNGHHIIFVNFDGVTLQPDYDDSIHDRSSIAASVQHVITVPPFDFADYSQQLTRDQIISDVMNIARKFYADFNVDLVTVRPQSGDYVMTAVGGLPDLIDQPCANNSCVAGLAPLDCQPGNPIQYNAGGDIEVVYAFSATAKYFGQQPYDSMILDLAVTVAQETAHSYGLGHSDNMQDVMYPQETGKTVGFLSGGYADNNNCAAGQGQQDAHALLLQILGPNTGSPADVTPPTVKITSPRDAAVVPRSFAVSIDAADDVSVDHIDVQVAGPAQSINVRLDKAPYQTMITVPSDGAWALSATAFDAAGNSTADTINLSVASSAKLAFGAPCTSGGQCQSAVCSGGVCSQMCGKCPSGYVCDAKSVCEKSTGAKSDGGTATQPGSVGAACAANGDCDSMICAEVSGFHYCTAACDPSNNATCPDGMVCTDFGPPTGALCNFGGGSGGSSSGCAVAVGGGGRLDNGSTSWAIALLFALALAGIARRRTA